jgi:uncharacterized membrane protein YqjE
MRNFPRRTWKGGGTVLAKMPVMEAFTPVFAQLGGITKRLTQKMLALGSNRVELLVVEIQEAKIQLLQATLVAAGVAVFGLLTGIAASAMIVVALWNYSPLLALGALTSVYGAITILLYLRFDALRRNWKTFPATLEQLRKDCECLEESLN